MLTLLSQTDYDRAAIKQQLAPLLDQCSLRQATAERGSILLKPNFVMPAPRQDASTTHPEFYMAVAELLLERGFKVGIGESPAFGSCASALKAHDVLEECHDRNIAVVEFKNTEPYDGVADEKHYQTLTIARELNDWDAIINLPKLKVHQQFTFTAATKNLYGCVTGKRKFIRHNICGNNPVRFARMILANAEKAACILHIGDGIQAMHIKGPRGGGAYPLGKIIVADDYLNHDWLELLQYGSCERCYVERYRLGIPAHAARPPESFDEIREDPPGEDELPPSERGIAVHDVLRIYDPGSPESLEELARARLRRFPGGGEGLVQDVVAMVRSFYECEMGRQAAVSPAARREAPFLTRWPVGDGDALLLRGQIDLLYPGEEGALTVVDYKTGATPSARYEIQLVAYAMALERFADAGVGEACIVRLSPGEDARVHRVDLGWRARERIREVAEGFAAFLAAGAPLPREHDAGCSAATGSAPARA